jgi:spore maturation protein CgeB
LDTPVTLERLRDGEHVPYLGPRGLRDFDLVLSYTGGGALAALRERLGARRAEPLYGSVDPAMHQPAQPAPEYQADLSYLGTYAADRQATLEQHFIGAARRLPEKRFLIGGAQYPGEFPWTPNIYFVWHVEPSRHPAFFCSSPLTLNVTRRAMAEMGWCPSGRLFEAAACGAPIVTDRWAGLDEFFVPGDEILVADSTDGVVDALAATPEELARIARRARERVLDTHTATHRARELVALLDDVTPAAGRESAGARAAAAPAEAL